MDLMDTTQVERQVLGVLGRARPDDMLGPLQELLAEHLGATDVQILLANYQLTALRPIHHSDADADIDDELPQRVALTNTLAGKAFEQQQVITQEGSDGGVNVCVPVGVRGERIGVLALRVGHTPDHSALLGLARVADTLAYAVQAAAHHTDAMAWAARSRRMTLAAELQWQLLPGRGCQGPEYQLAGHLEPAYRVQADNFDWSQNKDQLTLSVTDAARQQGGTSLLPTLAVTALRNARRAGLGVADQAILAGQAVYAHHQGNEHISTLLVRINLSTGRASAIRAGSPRLFIQRGPTVLEPELTDQDPLGMFPESEYIEEHFILDPGDRLLLVTDGVHATHSPARERYADATLINLLERTREQSITSVMRAIIDGLYHHQQTSELDDDAVILIIDWTGPTTPTTLTPTSEDVTGHVPLRHAGRLRLAAI